MLWLLVLTIGAALSACDPAEESKDNAILDGGAERDTNSDSIEDTSPDTAMDTELSTATDTEPILPNGSVHSCSGACPLGECWSSCGEIYDTALDENTDYCPNGHTGSYCLQVNRIDSYGTDFFAVNCVNGDADIAMCGWMCSVNGEETLSYCD